MPHLQPPDNKSITTKLKYTLGTVYLIVFVSILFVVLLYAQGLSQYDQNVAACQRSNLARAQFIGLLNDLADVNRGRIQAGIKADSPHSEILANREALHSYTSRKQKLYNALDKSAPVDSNNPGYILCDEAYSKPWPL